MYSQPLKFLPRIKPLALAVLAAGSMVQTSHAELVHPGMTHKQSDLDRMKYQVAAQVDPWYSSYQEMSEDSKASYDYEVQGDTSMTEVYRDDPYTNKSEWESDSRAAYYNAIRWIVEGDSRYAEKAIEIFNAWTGITYVQHSGTHTLTGSMVYIMLEAAEIIKSTYDGWSDEEIQAFSDMLVYPGYSNTEVPEEAEEGGSWYWRIYMGDPNRAGNQELSGWRAVMAMGIFLDNEIMYDRAYRYIAGMTHRSDDFAYHSGPNYATDEITTTPYNIAYNYESSDEIEDYGFDGVLTNYVLENGQAGESSRDQGHTMWGLSLIGALAEMAWSQGDDLWGHEDNRYLLGLEFSIRYNLSYLQSYDDQEEPWEPTVESGEYMEQLNRCARTKALAINPYYEYDYDGDNVSRGNLSQSFYELTWGHYVGRGFASEDDDAKWLTRGREYHLEDNGGIEKTDSGGAYIGWGGLTYHRPDGAYGDPISGFDENGLPVYAMNVLPMTIEAENYDYNPVSGEGRIYSDTTDGNEGDSYRTDQNVDLQQEAPNDSYNIGWIDDGEYVTYTVYAPTSGYYHFNISYAAPDDSEGQIQFATGDGYESEIVTLPSTGSYYEWQDLDLSSQLHMSQGVHSLIVKFPTGGFNLNAITITEGEADENLALNGTATQSSDAYDRTADLAIDGDTDGDYSNSFTGTHTQAEYYAWWQVDLGGEKQIQTISVYNRTDCCTSRLSDFTVYVLDDDGETVYSQDYDTTPSPSVTMTTGGVEGRVVRIELNEYNYLSLAEVEVFGSEISDANDDNETTENETTSSDDDSTDSSTDETDDTTVGSFEWSPLLLGMLLLGRRRRTVLKLTNRLQA